MEQGTSLDRDFHRCIERFFNEHPLAFDSYEARAAFLIGSLVQMLLDVQYRERNATPFWKKLKGLKLSPKEMVALVPEAYNKLQEYDALTRSRRELVACISHYLTEAGNPANWKLGTDEANLYLVMGMSLLTPVVWDCMPVKEAAETESSKG